MKVDTVLRIPCAFYGDEGVAVEVEGSLGAPPGLWLNVGGEAVLLDLDGAVLLAQRLSNFLRAQVERDERFAP